MTMFTNPQRVVTEEAKELRKAAGAFLRAVRERQGLTQHDVGTFAGYRYYTQYSALEQGTGRVPPERYAAIAAALGLAPSYFARKMMRYYDPLTFAAVLDEADIDHKVMVLSAPLEAPALVPELSAEDAKTLRREAGTLVKTLREEAGMTQADLAEAIRRPQTLDGISLLGVLHGRQLAERDYLYWELHEPTFQQAIRAGKWKGLRTGLSGPIALYDLENDPGESTDVAGSQAEVVERLEAMLDAARTESADWPVGSGQ